MSSMISGFNNWNGNKEKKTISKQDYELFCKEYIFDNLKGKSFGQAFCERFQIQDHLINNVSNDTAKFHIEMLGYIK